MSDKNRGEDILDPNPAAADEDTDDSLRPQKLEDFIGQARARENLKIFIEAAKQRCEALDHVLLSGPPGLGKTTMAQIVAKELGVSFRPTSGPALERAGDIAALLTNLERGDVLFIDEIHRLNRMVEEVLYPAMEDFKLDIIIGKGPSARSIRIDLANYTMIGATTRTGLLTSPLRDRFGVQIRLDYYDNDDLEKIIIRSSRILEIECDAEGAREIASRSRGTPRIANRLLKRVRDYAQVRGEGIINRKSADEALRLFEVDELGLDRMDKTILLTMIHKFSGGPVGVGTISVSVGEESETIEEVYEPYLLKIGFLQRTPRGRVVTRRACEHLGVKIPRHFGADGSTLFD